ncbi:E3 ubiquitin-protein ligase HUWE1-like, partial [Mustelus asterias]
MLLPQQQLIHTFLVIPSIIFAFLFSFLFSHLKSETNPAEGASRRDESPMDVDQPSPAAQESLSLGSEGSQVNEKEKEEEKLPELPLLSEQLSLDELWDMLGECLKELEDSHDQHAVLGELGRGGRLHPCFPRREQQGSINVCQKINSNVCAAFSGTD